MKLPLLLCFGLISFCTAGQIAHDVDILTELKKLQKAQEECTKKFSELDEYKFRVLSSENTVKDLQDAVKDLEGKNKELVSAVHRLEDDKIQTAELNVNNYDSKTDKVSERLQSADDRYILNTTYPLQENVNKSMKMDDHKMRSAIKRSFTVRPSPTNPRPTNLASTNPGQVVDAHVAFTVALSPSEVNLGSHNTVIFDNVITNIGSAYQPSTGIFIAPLKGAYVFSLTMNVASGQDLYLQILNDGNFVNTIYADSRSKSDYTSTTKEWILEVNKGAEVWIRCGPNSGELHGNMHSMFTGYLLFETNYIVK